MPVKVLGDALLIKFAELTGQLEVLGDDVNKVPVHIYKVPCTVFVFKQCCPGGQFWDDQ